MTERPANHLLGQTSPYLLQHLHNPVDWYPWGEEALQRARDERRPIFLSIGYSACHWCHVMERESFENPAIAAQLNDGFVPIKVDREERPDIDEIYMNAVQLLTGQGGWPLSVFLTPDLRPFMGGTYFPPENRWGRIGFASLLQRITSAWNERADEVERSAGQLTAELKRIAEGAAGVESAQRAGKAEWARAVADLAGRFDDRWGGFGSAPKFPPDGALALLLREHAHAGEATPLRMATRTLDAMARGGLYDQIGGGFARYSVDERWLVPHFEKMLYNQALAIPNYLDGWLATRSPLYRRAVCETLDFVRRELRDAGGGLYSALDADSEGEEGRFYVWTPREVVEALGPADGELFNGWFDISEEGNFEGRSIPNLIERSLEERAAEQGCSVDELESRLVAWRSPLLALRSARVRPATDDKILTAWNGLAVGAAARAYQLFGRPEDLTLAEEATEFIEQRMMNGDRLSVSHRAGVSQLNGYLDDYAFLARGLIDLYEAAFDPRRLRLAETLCRTILARFPAEGGGFFFTSDDHEELLTRNRSLHDGALPSGAGVAVEAMLRLAVHLDIEEFRVAAEATLRAYRPLVDRMPQAYASLLLASEYLDLPPLELAVVGPDDEARAALLAEIRQQRRRRTVVQAGRAPVPELAILHGKEAPASGALAYLCSDYSCREPTADPGRLADLMDSA